MSNCKLLYECKGCFEHRGADYQHIIPSMNVISLLVLISQHKSFFNDDTE